MVLSLTVCGCVVRTDERLELRHKIEGPQLGVISVDVNKMGTVAASSSLNSQIRLWDIETGKLIKDIDAGPGLCPLFHYCGVCILCYCFVFPLSHEIVCIFFSIH